MAFLNPTLAFAALACIAAPIIIHLLFRRKRKPVAWGAMKFVLEAFKRHKKRLRLEQLLLLAARTLAVLFLALAVGRPMLAGARPADSRRARDLTIVLDNSLVSQTRPGGPGTTSELETSKLTAVRVLEALDAARGDRATVVTLASPAERLLSAPTGDFASVRRVIEQIQPADSAADFAGAAALARETGPGASNTARESTIALLSSLRAGSIDLSREHAATTPAGGGTDSAATGDNAPSVFAALPAQEPAQNVAIVGVEPLRSMVLRSGGEAATPQARVALRRFGSTLSDPATIQLRLRVTDGRIGDDEKTWAKTAVRFAPGEDAVTVLAPVALRDAKEEAIPVASWIEARIDDDAIAGDNLFRRPWRVREHVRVGLLAPIGASDSGAGPAGYSAADWLTLALAPTASSRAADIDGGNETIRIARIDPTRLTAPDLAALDAAFVTRPDLIDPPSWPLLGDFARRGGLLIVCPAPGEGAQKWTDAFGKATGIAWQFDRDSSTFTPAGATKALAGANADQPIIASLGADLTELIKPVVVSRILHADLKGDGAWLLRLDDNTPVLASTRPPSSGATASQGLVVAFFVAPELLWTNLPAMPLMVPLVQEIVRQGIGLASASTELTAGSVLDAPDALRAVEPKEASSAEAVARSAGVWRRVDARGVTKDVVAVNADPRGSSTAAQQKAQLEPFLRSWIRARELSWNDPAATSQSGTQGALGPARQSPPIDLPLLLAGLCLLVADVIFSRLFSHATVRADRSGRTEEEPARLDREAAA
ncbi:MAG: BatA domain-containing protein [Planctomycetes bacterium]|nr:BatA domain-containing protein [Planctomycetota bacterium]